MTGEKNFTRDLIHCLKGFTENAVSSIFKIAVRNKLTFIL